MTIAVIFTADTKEVVGVVQPPHDLDTELINLERSELAGQTFGVAWYPGPVPPGMVPTIDGGGSVEWVPDSRIASGELAKASAIAKLEALGFMPEEIGRMVR